MLPKVEAACDFARKSGGKATIGGLADIGGMLEDKAGTIVSVDVDGVELSR
jgi:carbamate kinase